MRNEVYQPTASDHPDDDITIDIKPTIRVPLLWKITLVVLIVIILLLMIGLIVLGNRLKTKKECQSACSSSRASALGYESNLELPEDATVFQDLSMKELNTVRNYLMQQKALNLKPFETATLSDNFIVLIELYLPPKKQVIAHLDKGGKKPERRARVVVSHGSEQIPHIKEYLVEGLPDPSRYYELVYKKNKNPIPFEARLFTSRDENPLQDLITKAGGELYRVLKESFGYWMKNCTTHCIFPLFNGIPGSSKVGERKFWFSLLRRVPGMYLHSLPMQIRVDTTSKDSSKWKVDQIMYNFQKFSSVSEFLQQYDKKGAVHKIKLPVPNDEQLMRSSLKRRRSSERVTQGPEFVEPDGKRFLVEGRSVTYKNWQFHVGLRSSTGLAIYDVRFKGKRIAYELSLQEGAAQYSGHAPQASSSYYLDSAWGLGWSSFELLKGIDCPKTATYLDTFHYVNSGEPYKNPNSICIFELNSAITSRRHREWRYSKDRKTRESVWFLNGLVDRSIVVRAVTTPYNYDYTFDYVFHENGVIEVKTSTSGYALHTYYNEIEDPFGYKTTDNALGQVHDHYILHKVDLDISGTANSFQTLDMEVKRTKYEWETGTNRYLKNVVRNTPKKEMDAAIKFDFDNPKYYLFINENKKNRFNWTQGYRILPINMVKQIYPDSFFSSASSIMDQVSDSSI